MRGKTYTQDQRNRIVYELLKPYFLLGQSIERACMNAQIPPTTVREWIADDDVVRRQIESWQSYRATRAERYVSDVLEDRLENIPPEIKFKVVSLILKTGQTKGDYSERTETDITTQGNSINNITVTYIDKLEPNSNQTTEGNTGEVTKV